MLEKIVLFLKDLSEHQVNKNFKESAIIVDTIIFTAEKHKIRLTDIFYGDCKVNGVPNRRNVLVDSIISEDLAVAALIAEKYPPKDWSSTLTAYRAAILTKNNLCMVALRKPINKFLGNNIVGVGSDSGRDIFAEDNEDKFRQLLVKSEDAIFILTHITNTIDAVRSALETGNIPLTKSLISVASDQVCKNYSNEINKSSDVSSFLNKTPSSKEPANPQQDPTLNFLLARACQQQMAGQLKRAHDTLVEARKFSNGNKFNFKDAVYNRGALVSSILVGDETCIYLLLMNEHPEKYLHALVGLKAALLVKNRDCVRSICTTITRLKIMESEWMYNIILNSSYVGAIVDHVPKDMALRYCMNAGNMAMAKAVLDEFSTSLIANRYLPTT